jgi:hypothetical protein
MFNDRTDARFGRFTDELAELASLVRLLTDNDAVTVSLTAAFFNAIISGFEGVRLDAVLWKRSNALCRSFTERGVEHARRVASVPVRALLVKG